MKIAFKTFGCKANSLDTDALYLEARRRGFTIVSEEEPADAYVINSCTVTERADQQARYQVGRFKRQNPKALVGIIGCYAQVAKEEALSLKDVDFVVGTANKFKMLDHFKGTQKRDQVEPPSGFLPEQFPGSRNARAAIKIQDGCNYRCSFCIIPQARGRSRSLPLDTVLQQIDDAYSQGFQEIVLTGIHLAHYGWDQDTDLMALLRRIFEKEGPRVRVSTLDPFEIPDGLIEMLKHEKRLCPHFHIALQSGDDSVLSGMRRIYKAQEFVEVTQKIRDQRNDTFIGVDVIVGFPGEGPTEFQRTVDSLTCSYWTKLHVFPFSERQGTLAAQMPDKVECSEVTDRAKTLRELSEARYGAFLQSQVGTHREVLLERRSTLNPDLWLGHTENYLPTLSQAPRGAERKILPSLIQGTQGERAQTIPT